MQGTEGGCGGSEKAQEKKKKRPLKPPTVFNVKIVCAEVLKIVLCNLKKEVY